MHKKTRWAGTMILLGIAIFLAACASPDVPAAPTTDANAVYTQAAATVSVGLTQSALENPTDTPDFVPPPDTPAVTDANPTPEVAQPGPGDATVTPAEGASDHATATITPATEATAVPTATKPVGTAPAIDDKAVWVSQNPADGTKIQKSATFTMTYIIKNTGKTTWTKGYALRYYAGPMSDPKDTNLLKEVKPGDTVEITFSLIAPDTVGKYTNVWVLSTGPGG